MDFEGCGRDARLVSARFRAAGTFSLGVVEPVSVAAMRRPGGAIHMSSIPPDFVLMESRGDDRTSQTKARCKPTTIAKIDRSRAWRRFSTMIQDQYISNSEDEGCAPANESEPKGSEKFLMVGASSDDRSGLECFIGKMERHG